jgi:hypothetical protein
MGMAYGEPSYVPEAVSGGVVEEPLRWRTEAMPYSCKPARGQRGNEQKV